MDWSVALDSLNSAIAASATPWRTDRLFPGDIEAFRTGGAGFAHGAAGVLWAQVVHGSPVDPEHEDWLRTRARGPLLGGPGLGDGAHGVAHVLDLLGHTGEAMDLLRRAAPEVEQAADLTWLGGLAGIGLNQLHLGARHDEPTLLAAAVRTGERVAAALDSGGPCGIDRPPGALGRARDLGTHGGLLRGWSGPCLLFLGLLDATGEDRWARAARQALGRDLDLCVTVADGTLQVDGGFVRCPTWRSVAPVSPWPPTPFWPGPTTNARGRHWTRSPRHAIASLSQNPISSPVVRDFSPLLLDWRSRCVLMSIQRR